MRWFWIDRFVEFESGRRAVALKNVSLAEEQIHDHFPGAPYMPNSLITEGIAQTGGLLVGEWGRFDERVVLAKISRIEFHFHAVPGDTLVYETQIQDIKEDGAFVAATSRCDGRLQAEAAIFFAHLNGRTENRELFDPAELLCMIRLLGLYDVGRDAQGQPIEVPARLLEAERRANEEVRIGS
jgi:3-hydroxyacyl-[acyl-carrier-protein] dehydratase